MLAFFYLNRLTCFGIQFLSRSHMSLHTYTHTHSQHTHKESGRRVQCCPPLLLPLKMCFFFSLSPRLPGRGTLPFVSKGTLSLSFPLLFSLPLIHGAQRARERARRSLSPGQGGPRGGLRYKGAQKQRGREGGREEITTEKGRCVCVFVFPCFVLFSARCGLGENDRRMSGWRECGCLV